MCYVTYREHDKGPEEFCSVLLKLIDDQLPFTVSVLGSHTNDVPGTYVLLCVYHDYFISDVRLFAENHGNIGE